MPLIFLGFVSLLCCSLTGSAVDEKVWEPWQQSFGLYRMRIIFVHPEDIYLPLELRLTEKRRMPLSSQWGCNFSWRRAISEILVVGLVVEREPMLRTALELPVCCQHLRNAHPKGWWLQAKREAVKLHFGHGDHTPCCLVPAGRAAATAASSAAGEGRTLRPGSWMH